MSQNNVLTCGKRMTYTKSELRYHSPYTDCMVRASNAAKAPTANTQTRITHTNSFSVA